MSGLVGERVRAPCLGEAGRGRPTGKKQKLQSARPKHTANTADQNTHFPLSAQHTPSPTKPKHPCLPATPTSCGPSAGTTST